MMFSYDKLIENSYQMLLFNYKELSGRRFKHFSIENLKTIDSLYAKILAYWTISKFKEGVYKEYVTYEDMVESSPKGQINFAQTIITQSLSRGEMICTYDELDDNNRLNQILKGILIYLQNNADVDEDTNRIITDTLLKYSNITDIDINNIHWKEIRFNNNNISYKPIIGLCKDIINEQALVKKYDIQDNDRMYFLFRRFVKNYITETYKEKYHIDIVYTEQLEKISLLDRLYCNSDEYVVIRDKEYALLYYFLISDRVNNELERDIQLKVVKDLTDYQTQYKVKCKAAIVSININSRYSNYEKMQTIIYRSTPIGTVTVDMHDQWKYILKKLDQPYNELIDTDKKRGNKNGGQNL